MTLNTSALDSLCQIAIEAARQSGALIASYAGKRLSVSDKEVGSSRASQVVTEVDIKSQNTILDCLRGATKQFDLGVLIEESEDDLSRFEKDYFWCIDPLDGTLPFIQQQPGYAVSIALVSRSGLPVIGVVYDPRTDTLYHAIRQGGAFRNGTAWSLPVHLEGLYEPVQEGGAVMSACWVLEQAPAYFMKKPKTQEGGGCTWDYAATACLFNEMGGIVCDCHGHALDLNPRDSLFMNRKGVLFASHRDISREVMSLR